MLAAGGDRSLKYLLRSKLIPEILLPGSVILMEVFSMYPWIVWLGRAVLPGSQQAPWNLLSCLILLGAAYLATRYFLKWKWPMPRTRMAIIICILVIFFTALRTEYSFGFGFFDPGWFIYIGHHLFSDATVLYPMIVAALMSVYILWRGIRRAGSLFYFSTVYRSFIIGLIASVFLLIIIGLRSPFTSFEQLLTNVGIHIAGFFFFGLLAMALTNLQGIQQKMQEKDGSADAFNRRWLYIITGIVALIVLVGIFFSAVFSSEILSFVDAAAGVVGNIFFTALYYFFVVIGYVVMLLVYVVRFLSSLIMQNQPLKQLPPEFSDMQKQDQVLQDIPPEIILVLKWVFIILVVALVIFLLIKAITRQLSPRSVEGVEETSESIWNRQEFTADFRRFITDLMNRLKFVRKKENADADSIPYLKDSGNTMLGIREIYRHLLWNAAQRGLQWKRSETPHEYAERIVKSVPGIEKQVRDLTDIYISVRYGNLKAEESQIDHANNLWRAVKVILLQDGIDKVYR
jgi:hypothetical protein